MFAQHRHPGRQTTNRIIKAGQDLIRQVLTSFRFPPLHRTREKLIEDVVRRRLTSPGEIKPLESKPPGAVRGTLFEDTVRIKTIRVVELLLQRITEDFVSPG